MAGSSDSPLPLRPPGQGILATSHETALCLIPPRHLWPSIDRLRSLYDKAYGKWPPHINIVYPFVRPENLRAAVGCIHAALAEGASQGISAVVKLDSAGVFPHRHGNTLYRHDTDPERVFTLTTLRELVLRSLGQGHHHEHQPFRPHLTIGQSEDEHGDPHKFLLHKISLMQCASWEVVELDVLVRERSTMQQSSEMKLWGVISLRDGSVSESASGPSGFYRLSSLSAAESNDDDDDEEEEEEEDDKEEEEEEYEMSQARKTADFTMGQEGGKCLHFDKESQLWTTALTQLQLHEEASPPTHLNVSSYNVLAEFTWPISRARYPFIIETLLSPSSLAHALVLQEITDDFLSYLLQDPRIRQAYPFVSHGPAQSQADIDPLPSLLNLVVLSKYAFDWEWVPFKRAHKGTLIARFHRVGAWDDTQFTPLVLATVHLTCGLTDGSVANKKAELQRAVRFLSEKYSDHPVVLAGDFNITTSSVTLDAAVERGSISKQTRELLGGFDRIFEQAGLVDAWVQSQSSSEHLNNHKNNSNDDGEKGATFDPRINDLAAKIVGSGLNNRPQRYDRIFVRGGEGLLEIQRFNHFGDQPVAGGDDVSAGKSYASDHWGVRATLRLDNQDEEDEEEEEEEEKEEDDEEDDGEEEKEADDINTSATAHLVVPVHLQRALPHLSNPQEIEDTLVKLNIIPSEDETRERQAAFDLLKKTILDPAPGETTDPAAAARLSSSMVVIPVGSYGLVAWTSTSDIDVLCIGPLSSTTFFALATQRLRRAATAATTAAAAVATTEEENQHTIKILRRVKAHSGTMLELLIAGIKFDLQYCPATRIAETWPAALSLPSSNPIFDLPAQTLGKLKSARDLHYLLHHDIHQGSSLNFSLAYRFIKTWAQSRGIYAAKFGYLGGFQIALLLSRVSKLLAHSEGDDVSLPDLLTTFFTHYASFNFRDNLVFDPFFHKHKLPPYTRTAREPLAILGYHPPSLNASHAASVPTVRTITEEFQRAAAELLGDKTAVATSWSHFLTGSRAHEFPQLYKSYIRIDATYWSLTPNHGVAFLGWLESRCVLLLVEISRRLPGLHARIWPGRFVVDDVVPAAAPNNSSSSSEYTATYLIGLDILDDTEKNRKEYLASAQGTLHSILHRFETQIRQDERYFDPKTHWMSARVANSREMGQLVAVDERGLARHLQSFVFDGENEEEVDDDDDEDDDDDIDNDGHDDDDQGGPERKPAAKKKKGAKNNKKTQAQMIKDLAGPQLAPGKKFRTAQDVMARLRWDPSLDGQDYLVGYEDRFKGAQEKALDAWKSDLTDEEFIPLHRVLYFRRKSDGRIVWERRTRRDEIFGSGV